MLEILIKRDRTEQDYSNEKGNSWSLWAARGLEDRFDWSSILMEARAQAPKIMETQAWQLKLIDSLKVRGSRPDGWPYMMMAGRLYTVYLMKRIHGDTYPHLKDLLKSIVSKGLARELNYTDDEIEFINDNILHHDSNLEMSYSQVEQYHQKYALRHRTDDIVYETPQFTMVRMAMAVYEHEPQFVRLTKVKELYMALNEDLINPPTPNYSSLGTDHYGMASCCLIAADDSAESILAAGNVAYSMTLASAGLGIQANIRAPGDPVDKGRVKHAGRLNYIRKFIADCSANKQGARGGAMNIYDTVYHPELEMMASLQNPRTPIEVRERRVNVTYQTNPFFASKAANREDFFTFTSFSAPDLYSAFFKADQTEFEELYAKYEADPNFKKTYKSAYDTLVMLRQQEMEVSTLFWNCPVLMNRHTPFKDTILQSNLCMEVMVPTKPFMKVLDLYGDGSPEKGEVGICNIGSIAIHNLPFDPKDPLVGYDKYKRAVRSQYEIIDYAIDNSDYRYPAIEAQAKSRRNASVGMSGVATLFAQMNQKFNTAEGRHIWHMLNERHAFACAEVALEMGIEKGNAPWMDRTKWPDGWLVIDTYKKTIDTAVDNTLYYDWENLRSRIIANKGIRFSCLVAHMPGEQSTRKGTGSNSIYPLFNLSVDLVDGSSAIPWAALDNDLIGHQYQMAWDTGSEDMAIHYGICQKFTDQGISADEYANRVKTPNPSTDDLVDEFLNRYRYGQKSKYYTRSLTQQGGEQKDIQKRETALPESILAIINSEDDGMGDLSGQSCSIDGVCST